MGQRTTMVTRIQGWREEFRRQWGLEKVEYFA